MIDPDVREAGKDLEALKARVVEQGAALQALQAEYKSDPDPARFAERRKALRIEMGATLTEFSSARQKYQILAQALIFTQAMGAAAPKPQNPAPTARELEGFVKYSETNDAVRWLDYGWAANYADEEKTYTAALRRAAQDRARRRRYKALAAASVVIALAGTAAFLRGRPKPKALPAPAEAYGGWRPQGRPGDWAFGRQWACTKASGEEAVLKLVAAEFSGTGSEAERTAEYIRKACTFRHPGVQAVLSVGVSPEGVYLVAEAVGGKPLLDALSSGKAFEPEAALRLMTPVARALDAAHAAGLVHGGITPERIVVDPDGAGRLVDFGVVRALAARAGPRAFSPAYASPEQTEGKLTLPSDVFSFGVVLYEMLFVRLPFEGMNLAVLKKERRFQPPSAVLGRPAPKADAFFNGLFEPAGRRRRPQAGALAAALSLEAISS